MFVSVLTAAPAVHVGSVTIAASVFSDRPLPDQTSWPWSGPEIKHTNESNKPNISEYLTLAVIPFGCEWFWMNTNLEKVSGSSWQQRCSALTGCGRVIQKSDKVNSEWWCAKAQAHLYRWRCCLRLVLQNEVMRKDAEIHLVYLLTTVSSLLIMLR